MGIDPEVVKRYLKGKEREGDLDQIIGWFSDVRYEKDISDKYRTIWDEYSPGKTGDAQRGKILTGLYRRIRNEEYRERFRRKNLNRTIKIFQKVAAVLFIPMIVFFWMLRDEQPFRSGEIAYSEIYSPPGTRTRFFLKDGSSGWLNGGSTLEFPVEFMGKSREVVLEGEAYFDVATDPKKPFVVESIHTRVIAHGTSFNVQSYPGDPEVRVTLVSGNISLFEVRDGKTSRLAELKPDQMAILDQDNRDFRIDKVDAERVTAWKEGRLVFRGEPLPTIVRKINRWYNVELIIKDEELSDFPFQATFVDETLDEVLHLLQHSAPIRIREMGREKKADGTFEKRKIELYYKP